MSEETNHKIRTQLMLASAINKVVSPLPFMCMLVIDPNEQKLEALKVAIDEYLYVRNTPVTGDQQVLKFDSAPSSSTTTQPNTQDITETN